MALAPLATVADLTALGVTVDPDEEDAVNAYLAAASSLVRTAAGSPISETTSTVVLEGSPATRLRLPGLPVRSASAALIDNQPATGWRLVSGALYRAAGWQPGPEPSEVTVTFTHGLTDVPDDIKDMVCRLAGQALSALRSGDATARAIESERIGDYQATYADVETGTMSLSDVQRSRLAARFGGGVKVVRTL